MKNNNRRHQTALRQQQIADTQPKTTSVTLVGVVQAGFPAPGDPLDSTEVTIDELLVKNKPATYLMRVAGLSMKGIGIYEGDVVVVDRSQQATNGKVVVAVVDGEFTLKRLCINSGYIELKAENPLVPSIKITEDNQLEIWGTVVGVVRSLW